MTAEVASKAHAGQVDKSGADYLTHPERVAGNVRRLFPEAPDEAVAVAWLHDAVEDTEVDLPALSAMGFSIAVVDGVNAADLMDNTDLSRVALLDEATAARLRLKYEKAHRLLQAS